MVDRRGTHEKYSMSACISLGGCSIIASGIENPCDAIHGDMDQHTCMMSQVVYRGFQMFTYYVFLKSHNEILRIGGSKNISSYDLFVVQRGIECAMFPHLYPTADFTDTGILAHYQATYSDNTSRIASIGLSWTRKCTSGIRAYAEHRDLSFFLYERHLAAKYFLLRCGLFMVFY